MAGSKDQLPFDFDVSKCTNSWTKSEPLPDLAEIYAARQKETWQQRCWSMLEQVRGFCLQCSMCSLGKNYCTEKDTQFDPHVFSNMKPSQFFVCGQNPGHNECLQYEPFVGDAGKFFNNNLIKNGMKREQLYITNVIKCHSINNEAPTYEQMIRCKPILQMELAVLRPKLIITLGSVAFEAFCPNQQMSKCFGKIIKSEEFFIDNEGVKVCPIYHPSPRNMNVQDRKEQFLKDIKILCKIIRKLEAP